MRVYPTAGRRPELPAALKPPAGAPRPQVVYWEHQGVNLGDPRNFYKSARFHSGEAPREGQVQQTFDAGPYAGKRMVLHAAARVEAPGGAGLLRLSAYNKQDVPVVLGTVKVPSGDWSLHELAVEVPADTLGLEVDLGLAGEGRVWWDDVSLAVAGGDGAAAPLNNPLDNPGFETAGYAGAASWDLPWNARRAGYDATLSEDRPKSGRRSLLVSCKKPDPASIPQPEKPLAVDLGGGISAMIPLALFDQDGKSESGKSTPAVATGKPDGWAPTGNDRTTRLADVALAWNVFQHFYPYFDVVQTDWPGELRRALDRRRHRCRREGVPQDAAADGRRAPRRPWRRLLRLAGAARPDPPALGLGGGPARRHPGRHQPAPGS